MLDTTLIGTTRLPANLMALDVLRYADVADLLAFRATCSLGQRAAVTACSELGWARWEARGLD